MLCPHEAASSDIAGMDSGIIVLYLSFVRWVRDLVRLGIRDHFGGLLCYHVESECEK